jgi:transcriptional regulator with XRE-family HTH domain
VANAPESVVPARLLQAFGDRVRDRRHELGLSQEQLGERAGLHRNYISGIEQGRRNIAVVNIVKLATALKRDPGELLDGLHHRRR